MGLFNFFSRTGYTDEHRNRILIGIKSLDETVYNQLMHPSTGYVSDKQLDIAYAKAELSYLTKVSNSKHADTAVAATSPNSSDEKTTNCSTLNKDKVTVGIYMHGVAHEVAKYENVVDIDVSDRRITLTCIDDAGNKHVHYLSSNYLWRTK